MFALIVFADAGCLAPMTLQIIKFWCTHTVRKYKKCKFICIGK